MRKFNPLRTQTPPRFNPIAGRDQVYSSLILPAAGLIEWTALNHIVVIYKVTDVLTDNFALIDWPSTPLPLYVRDNGTRYSLNLPDLDSLPLCYSTPYSGEVLTSAAIFEFWNAGAEDSSATLEDYTLTLSYRNQVCCCPPTPAGQQFTADQYTPYCQPFPVCLPICSQ